MTIKSNLIAVGVAAAVLGHWTPVLLVAMVITIGQQLLNFSDQLDNVAWLAVLWAQFAATCWRWSELLFGMSKIPELVMTDFRFDEQQRRICETAVDGSEWIQDRGDSAGSPKARCTYEAAQDLTGQRSTSPLGLAFHRTSCWSLLLQDLRQAETQYEQSGSYTSPRNTKFMGPAYKTQDIPYTTKLLRPLVKTTVHDIGIIARRLGMEWTIFKPEEGILSASGKNRVLYSTFEPSIGTLLHYTYTGDAALHCNHPSLELSKADVIVPTPEAAQLGFGILPGCKALDLPDYYISSIEDVYSTLNQLDPTCQASQRVRDVRGIEHSCTFGFSDLIPMAAPMIRLRGSTIIRLPIPTEYSVGLTCHKAGFVVFFARLRELVKSTDGVVTDDIGWVFDQFSSLGAKYPEWENEVEANKLANGRDLEFLEQVHDCWDRTTEYFRDLQNRPGPRLRYADLMAAHIKAAVNYWNHAWENIRDGSARDHYGHRDWIAEGAHMYWDYLPGIESDLHRKSGVKRDVVKEAWIMMMFRAMCWWRCHWMMEGENMVKDESRLPTRYWGSKQPVFIG